MERVAILLYKGREIYTPLPGFILVDFGYICKLSNFFLKKIKTTDN